jgi:shikimate kinase
MSSLNHHQRIYLIGMMGVGKSTIGKKMASLLGYLFIDIDKEIERREHKTISELFETHGEEYFRKRETEILRSLIDNKIIIATGGGTPCFNNNMQYILNNGVSIYLKAKTGLLLQRINRYPNKRPLLKGLNEEQIRIFIEQKVQEREPFYSQANYIFDIPASSAETIVKSIL